MHKNNVTSVKRRKESPVLMDTHVALLMYKIGEALFLYGYSRFGNVWLEHVLENKTGAVCYGRTCCLEIVALVGCYVAQFGRYLPMFQENRSVPSSRFKQSTETAAVCCGYTGCFANVWSVYCVENNMNNSLTLWRLTTYMYVVPHS